MRPEIGTSNGFSGIWFCLALRKTGGKLNYLETLLPLVRPGGLVIGHDMHRPAPSAEYVKAITTNPNLETRFLHMDDAGIAVTLKKR